ncbi:MAG: HesA/MoeB/ThiF family protein [Magnetococcales bacterium]|nr:HesA/MoeB/ThiF family protein [Magnetococcales bacterium]
MNKPAMRATGGSVLLLGVGGLGCAAALALTASGVQRLGLVDSDQVALSNLHRQILYRMSDLGQNKVERAAHHLRALAPELQVELFRERPTESRDIAELASGYDLLIDGTDNFRSRFAANEAAVHYRLPLVHGAAIGQRGQVCLVPPGGRPCLRCLFADPPPQEVSCRSEGVFGPLVGEVGWLMAMEAVKWLRGMGEVLIGRLLTIDLESARRRVVPWSVNPSCPVCPQVTGSSTGVN